MAKKITSMQQAIVEFINWRRTPLNGGSNKLLPRRFCGFLPGQVKQQPWPDSKIRGCFSNSYLAPKEWAITSGWMVMPINKFGHNTKTNKPIRGWAMIPHYWNYQYPKTPIECHRDGTVFDPLSQAYGVDPKCVGYIQDDEIYSLFLDIKKYGFNLQPIPQSFVILQDGTVSALQQVADPTSPLGYTHQAQLDSHYPSGWLPYLWQELQMPAGTENSTKFVPEFTQALTQLLDNNLCQTI